MGLSTQDVQRLSGALAQVLVEAIDKEGEKESGGGWNAVMDAGAGRYANWRSGYKLTGADAAVHAHGPHGIFSTAGLDNIVVNAHMTPQDLDPLLRVYPTIYMNPLFPSLTGFSEDTGLEGAAEPAGQCDTCPGGTMQGCTLTAQFGHVCRGSDEISITRVMQFINRGETTPLTLLGDILGPGGLSKMPNTPTEWLEVVTRSEMVKIAILIQRWIMRMTWRGDPAHNNVGGGYQEFPGLEMLVGTGKVDALTGTTCPSMDSLVMDFGFTDVAGLNGGNDIVAYISMMEYYTRHNADRMGLMPVNWVLAIRPELWYELTSIWPCRYLTDRCHTATDATGTVVSVNDNTAVLLRDQMREGNYLMVNGRRIPVVQCDGIRELHSDAARPDFNANLGAGEYASDIYYLPLTVRGGMSVLYWEHLDYSKADPQIALTRSSNDFWTDGGRFLWDVERQRGCYKMNAALDPRIVLRTPHVAARLDNVKYTPLLHLRSPWAGDPYFKKGGVSTRTNPADSWYSEWNQRLV